ncbi:MAG: hypothetical protein AB2598_03540 [Candidatus Thiodiazotropha sp.]
MSAFSVAIACSVLTATSRYEYVVSLHTAKTADFMTAKFACQPFDF